jgi:hypothetical protein
MRIRPYRTPKISNFAIIISTYQNLPASFLPAAQNKKISRPAFDGAH